MSSTKTYEYYKAIFKNTPKPFAFVDLDLLEENVQALKLRGGGKKIRIASKSIRCRSIIDQLLKSTDQFEGIMCFTLDEAVWLSKHGFDNLLMGYPAFNESQIREVCVEIKNGKYICLMVDLEDHFKKINKIAQEEDVVVPLCVDIDMSTDFPGIHFGVWRSSIRNVNDLKKLISSHKKYQNIRLECLMGYEAQIAGVGDNFSGRSIKNNIIKLLKKRSIKELRKTREACVNLLKESGIDIKIVNGGGTGSLESTREESCVTELTVGSGFFNSHLFDNYSNFKHNACAMFATEVVRIPKPGMVTCLGGGYIASGGTGNEKQPLPYLPQGLSITENEGTGEVQTPLVGEVCNQLSIGDPVFFRHSKAGELCERFNELYLVKNGEIIEVVKTYRGEGMCFL